MLAVVGIMTISIVKVRKNITIQIKIKNEINASLVQRAGDHLYRLQQARDHPARLEPDQL